MVTVPGAVTRKSTQSQSQSQVVITTTVAVVVAVATMINLNGCMRFFKVSHTLSL